MSRTISPIKEHNSSLFVNTRENESALIGKSLTRLSYHLTFSCRRAHSMNTYSAGIVGGLDVRRGVSVTEQNGSQLYTCGCHKCNLSPHLELCYRLAQAEIGS